MKRSFLCISIAVLSFLPFELKSTLKSEKHNENSLSFDNLLSYIRNHEGLKLEPYKCAGGYWTIGYGSLTNDTTTKITKEIAEIQLFLDTWDAYILAVNDGFKNEKAYSIAHFIYALGIGNWNKSKLRRLIKNGASKEKIENEWKKWIYIKKKKSKVLLDMRKQEIMWYFI